MKAYQNQSLKLVVQTERYPAEMLPALIEGMDNLREYKNFQTLNIKGFISSLILTTNIRQIYFIRPIILLAGPLILFFYFRPTFTTRSLFLCSFLLYTSIEICMNSARGDYNLIQYVFPASLAILTLRDRQIVVLLFLALSMPLVFYGKNMYSCLLFECVCLAILLRCVTKKTPPVRVA
jgi:hypothetical protein